MKVIVTICLSLFVYTFLQAEGEKKIGIFAYIAKHGKAWDPDSIKSGITGSEEAIIYMSQELAALGYKVLVFANPPHDSPHTKPEANPRFIDASKDNLCFVDIAIAWRMPAIAKILKQRAGKVYLWPHDTHHEQLNQNQIDDFDDVLWLSEWQREQWVSVNPGFAKFTKIFGNGINPDQFKEVQERSNPYSCIYGSNYARGLEILLNIWPIVKAKFPKATLDVYYGWQHWGLLATEKEAKMRAQVEALAELDVREHGLVSHDELNRAYERTALWTYPCISPETFCITALRAQLAGAIPVIIEGTALKESVRHGYKCSTQKEYLALLEKALQNANQVALKERRKMGEFILQEFTWKAIAQRWQEVFKSPLTAVKVELDFQVPLSEHKVLER